MSRAEHEDARDPLGHITAFPREARESAHVSTLVHATHLFFLPPRASFATTGSHRSETNAIRRCTFTFAKEAHSAGPLGVSPQKSGRAGTSNISFMQSTRRIPESSGRALVSCPARRPGMPSHAVHARVHRAVIPRCMTWGSRNYFVAGLLGEPPCGRGCKRFAGVAY